MSSEIVKQEIGRASSGNSFVDFMANTFVYFFMGLSFIVAPYAGKSILSLGSASLVKKSVNKALSSNVVSKKPKHQMKDNSSLQELLEIMKNSKRMGINAVDDVIELSKKMNDLIFGTSYSTNRFYKRYSTLEEVVDAYNHAYRDFVNVDWVYSEINNSQETVTIPKFSLTDLFGVKILHLSIKNNHHFSHIRYTKAIGSYIVSGANIPAETIDELFEIQEKIDELKADLESYENSSENVDEEIINAVKESIKIGQEKGESIVKTLTSDSLEEKGFDLYQKALTMDW